MSTLRFFVFACLALLCGVDPASAETIHENVRTGAAPSWVVRDLLPGSLAPPEQHADHSTYYHLADAQTRLTEHGLTSFNRYAFSVLNREGLESSSQISVSFDPSYQNLVLHHVRIIRDGQIIDALDPGRVQILQREEELEYLIYDGELTANLALEDVRVGDVIDYAYSISGANPVFEGRFYDSFQFQWGAPVGVVHRRITLPASRQVYVRRFGGAAAPDIAETGGEQVYRWHLSDVAALTADSDLPSWHYAYPWAQFSEARDWQDVIDWGRRYYGTPEQISPPLQSVIDGIASETDDPAGRIAKVLGFVQSQVRYLGIEIGPGSHAPRHPDQVLRQRFGDCKDKTMLMVTMLDRLGVEAAPALVHTEHGRTLPDFQPSPYLFDHVITKVRTGGQTYWLDPTLTRQASKLGTIHQPYYSHALVLSGSATGLEPMAEARPTDAPKAHAIEEFDFRNNDENRATYKIETRYFGSSADSMRRQLGTTNLEKLQENYLNFYAGTYPNIRVSEAMNVDDDTAANVVLVRESYVIDNAWQKNDDETRWEAEFYAYLVREKISTPTTRLRKMPLAVRYPVNVLQETRIKLSGGWDLAPELIKIEDDSLRYREESKFEDGIYEVNYRYQTLRDHVSSELSQEHIEKLEDIYSEAGLLLFFPVSEGETAAETVDPEAFADQFAVWVTAALVIIVVSFGLFALIWGARADREWRDEAVYHPVAIWKFALFSLITIGIYPLFWMYKCWDHVKRRDNAVILPFWRAFFGVFWFYPLMCNIKDCSVSRYAVPGWAAALLALAYFVANFVDAVANAAGIETLWTIVPALMAFLLFIPALVSVNTAEGQSGKALALNSRLRAVNYVGIAMAVTLLALIAVGWES